MKRMLSVILSMVLLVSSVVIPMSVSATVTDAEKTAAFDAVVNAVKNLDLDLNNVNPIEYAVPTASVGGSDNSGKSTISTVSGVAEKVILGDKKVEIKGDNKVTTSNGSDGLVNDHLHAIDYTPLSSAYVHLYRVGYFVIYVKTARPFKLSLGAKNNRTQNINFLNGTNAIEVPATGNGYTPVAINIQSGIDWTQPVLNGKNAKRLYAAEYVLRNLYVSVQAIGDDNTIKETDGITFGSAFYVPVDENVRDFRFDVTTSTSPGYSNAVQYRFTALSAEMIAAAEAIDNTQGNYTEDSFEKLQNAIDAAKKAFIDDGSNVGNVVDLFKKEVNNLYKLEEVVRPKRSTLASTEVPLQSAKTSEIVTAGISLSDKQKKYFGDYLVKVDNTTDSVALADKDVGWYAQEPGKYAKKYTDYKNLYLAVANTGDVHISTLRSYNKHNFSVNYFNGNVGQLRLNKGCNLISLYDLGVNANDMNITTEGDYAGVHYFKENNVLYYSNIVFNCPEVDYKNYFKNEPEFSGQKYHDGFNNLRLNYSSLPAGTSLYIGSLMGEKPFDTNAADLTNVDTKAEVFKYYNDHIKGKGYINTDDIEKTFSALGLFKIPVTGLYNPADIAFTGVYTFDAALPGETLTFKINNVPDDVEVSVTYGGVLVNEVGDVYTLTDLAEDKQLVINLSHITTEFASSDTSFQQDVSTVNNLALGKDPVVLITSPDTNHDGKLARNLVSEANVSKLSNSEFTEAQVSAGFTYRKIGDDSKYSGDYYNGYKPYESSQSTPFDFDRTENESQFEAYTDVIYDLGYVANINKVQHFGADDARLSLGAYEVFVSEKIEDLFENDSVIKYQNKTKVTNNGTILPCQQHEFPARKARFVAFRVYCPIVDNIVDTWAGRYNRFRISELAIYGTIADGQVDPGYKVSTGGLENLYIGLGSLTTPDDTVSLLSDDKLTVSGKKGVDEITESTAILNNMHDNLYGNDKTVSVAEFKECNFRVGKNDPLKNGYTIRRDANNFTGSPKIEFSRDEKKPIDTYLDLTYDLGDFYNVSQFHLYGPAQNYNGANSSIQAYRVYIGNDVTDLYNEKNIVVDYENYFDVKGQRITFDKPQAGKYIGVKILMVGFRDFADLIPQIAEIAAFGNKVDAPETADLEPAELSARSTFVYDYKDSSVYKVDDTEYTALRLSVGYSSPAKKDGTVDAGKIVLKDNSVANVIERNVIVMSKKKYDGLVGSTFDIHTAGSRASTVQGDKLDQYFRADPYNNEDTDESNDKPVDAAAFKVYGTYKFTNITEGLTGNDIVVLGRVVYELNGTYYSVYTDVAGTGTDENGTEIPTISPYNAYYALTKQPGKENQGWFKPANAN